MEYGAEFYNANGDLQLSVGASNFYMAEKGTASVNVFGPTSHSFDITPSISYDGLALVGSSGLRPRVEAMFSERKSAGTPTTCFARSYTSGVQTVTWYAFRSYKALSPATSGYGIELYGPDGSVGFSSTKPKILKVGAKIPITNGAAFNYALPSNKTFAFMLYGMVRKLTVVNGPSGELTFGSGPTVNYSPGNVYINCEATNSYLNNYNSIFAGGVLALDVTNY